MQYTKWLRVGALLPAILAASVATGSAQVTNFSSDVNASLDAGLAWLDSQGAFGSGGGDPAGLAALALLEKRLSANQLAAPQGYANATAADKVKLDNAFAYIIPRATNNSFYAYRDGGDLMALSVYLLTGGPDQVGATAALNATFDRVAANQGNAGTGYPGYWCYTNGYCADSSTTQLVMAGLAAARKVFSDPFHMDAARLATLNTLTTNARAAYQTSGAAGESCSPGGPLSATEGGHGYNLGSCNSHQQTASGTWIQIVGGADLNDATIQSFIEWIRNRYQYTSIAGSDWDYNSYYYYLWSSSKAYEFIAQSGVMPTGSNLTPDSLGLLAPASLPSYGPREVHRNPATDGRVASRGVGGAGYYASPFEPARWYYDYAYSLMDDQQADGHFVPTPGGGWDGFGGWERISNQAYALLVLERSIGGGCSDGDNDGACDGLDNCPSVSNANQADGDGDLVGDVCDNCSVVANGSQSDVNNNGVGDACDPTTAKIKLNVATAPGTGKSNVTVVSLTGSGFPAGAIVPGNVDVALSATCLGNPLGTTKATSVVALVGSSRKLSFKIPGGLVPGAYQVSVKGVVGGNAFASTNCSTLTVVP